MKITEIQKFMLLFFVTTIFLELKHRKIPLKNLLDALKRLEILIGQLELSRFVLVTKVLFSSDNRTRLSWSFSLENVNSRYSP